MFNKPSDWLGCGKERIEQFWVVEKNEQNSYWSKQHIPGKPTVKLFEEWFNQREARYNQDIAELECVDVLVDSEDGLAR